MSRRKRVQVGWYCDHRAEPMDERTHMSSHGRWRRQKWQETYAEPSTTQALMLLDYRDPKKAPHCPLAVPVYVYQEQS